MWPRPSNTASAFPKTKMKNLNRQLGQTGEHLAQKFLKQKGYRILAVNWRHRFGEIDLVAAKNSTLVFVEVKLKTGSHFGSPEQMITPHKLRQLHRLALLFLRLHPTLARRYPHRRLDAVCIVLQPDGRPQRISHWQNLTL